MSFTKSDHKKWIYIYIYIYIYTKIYKEDELGMILFENIYENSYKSLRVPM